VSLVWLCTSCSALHRRGEATCRRCDAARSPLVSTAAVARRADSVPLLLHLPPIDFPYSRTRRAGSLVRSWIAPAVLLASALAITVGWDPFVRRYDAARALGGESVMAERARRAELGVAAERLGALITEREASAAPPEWAPRVREVGERYRLDGNPNSPTLAPLEVSVRSAWLELVSLPPDGVHPVEIAGRLHTAKEELSRVTEDLSHAR
jgi:hypothetical protein